MSALILQLSNNELYIKLRTQVTSRVPYCCVRDKTFTSLNLVNMLKAHLKTLTPYEGVSSKQQEVRNEPHDVVISAAAEVTKSDMHPYRKGNK